MLEQVESSWKKITNYILTKVLVTRLYISKSSEKLPELDSRDMSPNTIHESTPNSLARAFAKE